MKFLYRKFVEYKKLIEIQEREILNIVKLYFLYNIYIYDLNLIKLNMLLLYFQFFHLVTKKKK